MMHESLSPLLLDLLTFYSPGWGERTSETLWVRKVEILFPFGAQGCTSPMAASSGRQKTKLLHSIQWELKVPLVSSLTRVQAGVTILRKGERETTDGWRVAGEKQGRYPQLKGFGKHSDLCFRVHWISIIFPVLQGQDPGRFLHVPPLELLLTSSNSCCELLCARQVQLSPRWLWGKWEHWGQGSLWCLSGID